MNDRRTFTIESHRDLIGDYRIRVGEHEDSAFVGIDVGRGGHAVMLEPKQLIALAGEMLNVASNIIERQFKLLGEAESERTIESPTPH